mmetsp:Transcript_9182/g.19954  ORF Transcript_9182/g.19954 Transcript_9182/m.19954 type:complete len:274 (-) Transcript_9182:10-831(-)
MSEATPRSVSRSRPVMLTEVSDGMRARTAIPASLTRDHEMSIVCSWSAASAGRPSSVRKRHAVRRSERRLPMYPRACIDAFVIHLPASDRSSVSARQTSRTSGYMVTHDIGMPSFACCALSSVQIILDSSTGSPLRLLAGCHVRLTSRTTNLRKVGTSCLRAHTDALIWSLRDLCERPFRPVSLPLLLDRRPPPSEPACAQSTRHGPLASDRCGLPFCRAYRTTGRIWGCERVQRPRSFRYRGRKTSVSRSSRCASGWDGVARREPVGLNLAK